MSSQPIMPDFADLKTAWRPATTADKVLCGIHLCVLWDISFGKRQLAGGRPRKLSVSVKFKTWGETLSDGIGINRSTAQNWMALADHFKKFADQEDISIRETCKKFPSTWSPDETALVKSAVHKFCGGKSQNDILKALRSSRRAAKADKPTVKTAQKVPLSDSADLAKRLQQEAQDLNSKAAKLQQSAARLVFFGHDFHDQAPRPGSEAFWLNGLFEKKQAVDDADLASCLTSCEREQIFSQILKPVLEAWIASGK